MLAIVILPLQALSCATKLSNRTNAMEAYQTIENIHLQFFTGLQLELVPDVLEDHYLTFRRHPYLLHAVMRMCSTKPSR
jgi:hypothetical protein